MDSMLNPICLSPLRFYDSRDKLSYHRSFAYNHISPLLVEFNTLPAFQFVLSDDIIGINKIFIKSKNGHQIDATQEIVDAGMRIIETDSGFKVLLFAGTDSPLLELHEGEYNFEIWLDSSDNLHQIKYFYSEYFCLSNSLHDCVQILYRNNSGDFHIKNGIITFPHGFIFRLYFKTDIGKPEYVFEEESTNRLGHSFIESQVSKKVYKFNAVLPEYICDAMRIIRLCDEKIVYYKGEEYDAMSFEMDVEWQTQGDLASVTCEFETDNIIVNLGGFD